MDEDVEYVEEWVDLGYSQQAFVGGGEFIDGGVSGIVERHGNHVVKTPWMGPDNRDAQEDMRREARVYQKLFDRFGFHDRFVKTISFDSRRRTITMEYMSNGTLRNYLQSCNQSIRPAQRHAWIKALAEGLEMLHAIKILHTDFTPRNMLLDDHLELKVADFGCSTVDGLNSDAGTNARFYPTPNEWGLPATREADLFALGSCIYEVLTGAPPYSDVPSDQVRVLHTLHQFSDLTGLDCGDIIRDCWLQRAHSAQAVRARIDAELGSARKT